MTENDDIKSNEALSSVTAPINTRRALTAVISGISDNGQGTEARPRMICRAGIVGNLLRSTMEAVMPTYENAAEPHVSQCISY